MGIKIARIFILLKLMYLSKMKLVAALLVGLATSCNAFISQVKPQNELPVSLKGSKNSIDFKNAAVGAFAALTIASNVFSPTVSQAFELRQNAFDSSSTVISEKVIREGLYNDYEVDTTQQYDDARSTFKGKAETSKKKGKYTALLAVLIVGSFIIPMAQYFWYVREDDSVEQFFEEEVPEPKKKGWFN